MFDIALDGTLEVIDGRQFFRGEIAFGENWDSFLASVSIWTPNEYRVQWLRAARDILGVTGRSAFVTSLTDLDTDDEATTVWPAWRQDGLIYIQQRLLVPGAFRGILDMDSLPQLVGDLHLINEDGDQLSTGRVTASDLAAFAA